jgi:anti-anti-sigma factor
VVSPTFELVGPQSAEALSVFRADVVAKAEAGGPPCVIDLDGAGVLDSPMIAALIATLREVREIGGTIVLVASRNRIVETLKITGLDQVFEVVAPGDPRASGGGKPPEPRRPGQRTRARFATFVLGALVALSGAAAATAQFHGPSDGSIVVSDAR